MKKIDTLADLKAERIKLRLKRNILENEIENNFIELKESFAPLRLITEGASNALVNKHHGVVNEVVALVIDLVLKKGILKNSGFIAKFFLPFIARNSMNNIIHENKTKILGWVGELILKIGNRSNHQGIYDKTTADTNL